MKKKFSIVMALCLSLAVFFSVGCGGGGGLDDYKNRPKTVKVLVCNNGYGYKWLQDVSKYYMDNVDTETYIDIKATPEDATEGIKLAAGVQTHDVYALGYLYDPSSALDYLVDLSDVYDGPALGETGKISDKISSLIKEAYIPENGNPFQLPLQSKQSYAFCYNKTVVDAALGEGEYVIPRTTDELFEFGDSLKAKNVFLTAFAIGDRTDYFGAHESTWLAQIMGKDNYFQAIKGNYDNQGVYELAESYPYMISANEDAYEAVYEVMSRIGLKSNRYAHINSEAMDFRDIERALSGLGFSNNKSKVAYLFSGPWLENEMQDYLDLMEENGTPQEIRAEKMPIISAIRNKTATIDSDAKLREVIDYVDGVTTQKPAGVSDEDIAFVSDARHMGTVHVLGSLAIGKKTTNLEGSKKFVRFLASDVAQKIALKSTNGIEMLPYGYDYDAETEGIVQSAFTTDMQRINRDLITINASTGTNDHFIRYGDFKIIPIPSISAIAFNTADESTLDTAQAYYEKTLAYYTIGGKWGNVIRNYKTAMGLA